MAYIYWVFVKFYGSAIRIASLFNIKAKDWIKGRRFYFQALRYRLNPGEKRIWFHCSSLGEFEQGKPVLDQLRQHYPNHKIVLTFFSPSGYNLKKDDPSADYVFYLPLDGPINSRRFIELVKPVFVIIVKYEFWHFYIKALYERKIPVFVISAIFRPSQIYFKKYGLFFYKIIQRITHLFVQDQASLELLYNHSLTNVTVSGDTRFDRVIKTRSKNSPIDGLDHFVNQNQVLIAGSTWATDEQLLLQLINSRKPGWKYIIAPHEINSYAINKLKSQIELPVILYSEFSDVIDKTFLAEKKVLIIDNVGLLSRLYVYGDIAYIGGGFGVGIHNILEAAVFGLPIFFGPNYQKFKEAVDLVKLQTAFSIVDYASFLENFELLTNNKEKINDISKKNLQYVESKSGATEIISNYLKMNYPNK